MRTLRDLKIVRALAAHRNFARASEELGMAQPTLSRALARLETLMGVRLFERTRTSVVPTVYAEIVLERCDALIAGFEDIVQTVDNSKKAGTADFRISAGPFAAEAVVLAGFAAHAAKQRRPSGRLVVRDWRTCLEDVLAGYSTLAITDTQSANAYEELETAPLGGGPAAFFCHCRHPLARENAIGWADLMRYPWALTLMQGRWLDLLPDDLGAAGRVDPKTGEFVPAICVDSFSAMTAAVRNGRAISAAPPSFIRDELERGELVVLPLSEAWMRIEYGLVWRKDQKWSRNLSDFVDTLQAVQTTTGL
ncbi:MAG TPA: LysR family transcriptional regulator [Alphaproteobacteria bacterium]|nr:LysR family transcriptional regulator [Alphaproteobacteria bacterium]